MAGSGSVGGCNGLALFHWSFLALDSFQPFSGDACGPPPDDGGGGAAAAAAAATPGAPGAPAAGAFL